MLSYSKGPDVPLLEDTISEAFLKTAKRFPNHDALIVRHQGVRLTFAQLVVEVEGVARGLTGLGLEAGDRIGVWSTNCVEWVLLHLACARIGAVLVNVNPAYRAYELAFVLRKSRNEGAVSLENATTARTIERSCRRRCGTGPAAPARDLFRNRIRGREMLAQRHARSRRDRRRPDDVTNIQYTSGTTGSPKGVLLTHRNLVNNAV